MDYIVEELCDRKDFSSQILVSPTQVYVPPHVIHDQECPPGMDEEAWMSLDTNLQADEDHDPVTLGTVKAGRMVTTPREKLLQASSIVNLI